MRLRKLQIFLKNKLYSARYLFRRRNLTRLFMLILIAYIIYRELLSDDAIQLPGSSTTEQDIEVENLKKGPKFLKVSDYKKTPNDTKLVAPPSANSSIILTVNGSLVLPLRKGNRTLSKYADRILAMKMSNGSFQAGPDAQHIQLPGQMPELPGPDDVKNARKAEAAAAALGLVPPHAVEHNDNQMPVHDHHEQPKNSTVAADALLGANHNASLVLAGGNETLSSGNETLSSGGGNETALAIVDPNALAALAKNESQPSLNVIPETAEEKKIRIRGIVDKNDNFKNYSAIKNNGKLLEAQIFKYCKSTN